MTKTPPSTRPRRATKSVSAKRPPRIARPTDGILKLVGARIREVRKEKGVSQDNLAYSIPLDRSHIGLIENGKRAATTVTLVKIARALECEVGDLFPNIDEMESHVDWGRE